MVTAGQVTQVRYIVFFNKLMISFVHDSKRWADNCDNNKTINYSVLLPACNALTAYGSPMYTWFIRIYQVCHRKSVTLGLYHTGVRGPVCDPYI